jgi:hypothetical protein
VRSCLVPRSPLRPLFHSADVPAPVMDADDALQSRVPVQAAAEVITPGFAERFAAEVAVPPSAPRWMSPQIRAANPPTTSGATTSRCFSSTGQAIVTTSRQAVTSCGIG